MSATRGGIARTCWEGGTVGGGGGARHDPLGSCGFKRCVYIKHVNKAKKLTVTMESMEKVLFELN